MLTLIAPLLLAPFAGSFTMHRALDPATGLVAYRYLLPQGWTSSDTVTWDLTNKLKPFSSNSKLTSADSKTVISILPAETMAFQVENGKLSGTLPPETATKALDSVLAAEHPGLQNAKLVVRKDFDVPSPFDGQSGLKAKGLVGILEVSFEQGGHPMTELLAVTEYEGIHQGDGGLVQGIWMMLGGFTLTCSGPITEDAFKTFATVAASDRTDPTFFATLSRVSQQLQNGTPDPKSIAAGVNGLDADEKSNYGQSLMFRVQSLGKMFPIYPGETDVTTYDGPMTSYKGVHVWMKKPDQYQVTDGAASPGNGWEPAK